MEFTLRPFDVHRDYAPLRHMLNRVWAQEPRPWVWPTVRLDSLRYGRFWREELAGDGAWAESFQVWERHRMGRTTMVGVTHHDSGTEMWMQVSADIRRSPFTRAQLENMMIAWLLGDASIRLAPGQHMETMAYTYDAGRQQTLQGHGWTNRGPAEVSRRRNLRKSPQRAPLADGFSLRTLHLDDPADLERLSVLVNRVFPRAKVQAQTWESLANAPTWNENWVVMAPTGEFASCCAIWYEPGIRAGWFEPVGTHPAYRRLGLAHAVMTAGLQRLAQMGAQSAYVDTGYGMDANQLYDGLGFTDTYVAERWVAPGG